MIISCFLVTIVSLILLFSPIVEEPSTWKYDHGYEGEAEISLKGDIGPVKLHHAKPPRDIYAMNGNPHGVALIINIKTFSNPTKYETREGTDIDRDNLQETFRFLGYDVVTWDDSEEEEMKNIANVFKEKSAADHDSFVCCILSHGNKGKVVASDSTPVHLEDIISKLEEKCPHLRDKPKMFFIQACRGEKKLGQGSADDYGDGDKDENEELQIPEFGADFFFGYATVSGYVAHRCEKGSPYIKLLCETLCKHGRHTNLVTMHTMLNHDISRKKLDSKHEYIQVSEFEDSLRKFVYFFKQPRQ